MVVHGLTTTIISVIYSLGLFAKVVSSIGGKFVYYVVILRAAVISQSCLNRIKPIFAATGVIWAVGSTENEGCSFPNSLFIN